MGASMKYFIPYLRPYRFRIFFILILVCIAQFLVVYSPEIVSQALNEIAAYIAGNQTMAVFNRLLTILVAISIGSWVIHTIQNAVISQIAGHATHAMRVDLFRKLERLPIRFFDTSNDGDILARFTSDLDNISNTLNQSIHEIVGNIVMFVIAIIMMFQNHVTLSLAVVSTLPLVLVVALTIIFKAQKYVSVQQSRIGALNGYVDEQFSGQRLIIANGLHDLSEKGFDTVNEAVYTATYKGQVYSNLLFPALQGLSLVTNAVVIFVGAWMTATGNLDISVAAGTLFLFTQYVRMIYQPLTQIASLYTQVQLALTGAKRILEVMNEDEEVDLEDSIDLATLEGKVELKDVTFGYDSDTNVLHNINIHAAKGQMIALVGHTGSGKTTIMNLLNRFYDVEHGVIAFDDKDIRLINRKSLRKHVGIVLQDSVLFSGTLHDNIAFGKKDASREEVIEAATKANIHDFIMTFENGYDTEVSDDNSKMSQGQKQLFSIARTMLVNPSLLILDEATSNVDTVTERKIQQAMDTVIQGRTSFVIAHRLKTILEADKIIVLSHGKIIETGTHETLLADGKHYASLYHNQFSFEVEG